MKITTFHASLGALCLAGATPLAAQVHAGANTYAVTLTGVNPHPATPHEAHHALVKIEKAAMLACGAPEFAIHELRRAVRAGPCWNDAVANTVNRLDDPLLTQAYQARK